VIWAGIIGASAIAVAFLCYCFRCVTHELRSKRTRCDSLISIAEPPPQECG
jgi:hypothetical protein